MAAPIDTVIHLVSGETMQNILPILALRPRRVVQIHSRNENFAKRAIHTEAAVRLAGTLERPDGPYPGPDTWQAVALDSASPSIAETYAAVAKAISASGAPNTCVNYTGGTKNMSVGAWKAADDAGAASVYCDTPRAFLSGDTAPLPLPLQLSDIAQWITVPMVLASSGLNQGAEWYNSVISDHMVELGETGYRLLQSHRSAFVSYRADLIRSLAGATGDFEPPRSNAPELTTYVEAAVKSGLLQRHGSALAIGSGMHKRAVQAAIAGGSFEAYVASLHRRSQSFTHFLSNVTMSLDSRGDDRQLGETDFVSYAPKVVGLTLVSCKFEPPKLEHLESIVSRRNRMGGLHAKAVLCIEHATAAAAAGVRRRCTLLGIQSAFGFVDDEEQPDLYDVFAVPR